MRQMLDETANFYDAVMITMCLEERFGIAIADETLESIRPWNELTLEDLATAARRSTASDTSVQIHEAVVSAVRAEFPKAPERLDFSVPLVDAISPNRSYGGYEKPPP